MTPPLSDAQTELADPAKTRLASESEAFHVDAGPRLDLLNPGEAFGTRYRILRVLGAGGMGVVYHAWDQELGIAVALKVIRREVTADPALAADLEKRFKRELLLARKVSHRNVVRIHDIGQVGETKYITMSFVDGRDLATTLKTAGHLPVARVVHYAKQLAAGLQEAHAAGVIHRDLKPANIMVEGDDLLITDFGIARSAVSRLEKHIANRGASVSRGDLVPGDTVVGAVVGTVAYMSPEQAAGQPADERSDIYAFGMVMRDMLVGMRALHDPNEAVTDLMARVQQPPKAVQKIDPSIPDEVDALVTRCLLPDPAKRFQSVAELLAALNALDLSKEPTRTAARPSARGWPIAVAAVVVALVFGAVGWYMQRPPAPPAQHEPVSVVIADFTNGTGDPTFDRTLEPMLKIALEDAGFVTAFDRNAIRRGLGVKPPDTMDERAAQEIAVRQGLGVVLAGSLTSTGGAFEVTMKAVRAVTGDVIATVKDRASRKTEILSVATKLAGDVRTALGDDTSDSAKRFAMESLSATSLPVVRAYAAAAESMSRNKYDEAFGHFSKAVALDPKFGLGYAGMAISSRNLDKQQDAEKYIKEAVRHLDGTTERERYRTRGLYYLITGDYQNCVKEFGDLIARFSADASARNNLALCATHLRDWPRAVGEMRKVIEILPKRPLYRVNLALYSAYSGDAQAAEQEARAIPEPELFGILPIAFSQLLQGQPPQASETYQSLATLDDELGASYSASGLGDVALYEGRYSDAAAIFSKGAAADLAAKDTDRAANKFAALAYVRMLQGQNNEAVAAAEQSLKNSTAAKIRLLAARVFAEAGASARAREVAATLASEVQPEPQAYAKIADANIALKSGDARSAAKSLTEANALFDTWLGHFDLGRAYLEMGTFTQADSEFDRCIKRRGEALALFLDEEPTFGYFPPVYYYQGRVREALKSSGFAESYKQYLALRGSSKEDPLAADARTRTGS